MPLKSFLCIVIHFHHARREGEGGGVPHSLHQLEPFPGPPVWAAFWVPVKRPASVHLKPESLLARLPASATGVTLGHLTRPTALYPVHMEIYQGCPFPYCFFVRIRAPPPVAISHIPYARPPPTHPRYISYFPPRITHVFSCFFPKFSLSLSIFSLLPPARE